MSGSYDATRSLDARPPNWGMIPDADVRVDVTHTQGTGAVLTWKLDGGTVTAARFKSRGLGDRTLLLARAVRASEGRKLSLMQAWQVKQVAEAIGIPVPTGGMDRTALELALLAVRNAIHAAGADTRAGGGAATALPGPGAEDQTVCYCMDVSAATILDAIRNGGATTVEQITAKTGAVGGCGTCRPDVQDILNGEGVTPAPDDPTAPYRQAGGPPWVLDARDEERGTRNEERS